MTFSFQKKFKLLPNFRPLGDKLAESGLWSGLVGSRTRKVRSLRGVAPSRIAKDEARPPAVRMATGSLPLSRGAEAKRARMPLRAPRPEGARPGTSTHQGRLRRELSCDSPPLRRGRWIPRWPLRLARVRGGEPARQLDWGCGWSQRVAGPGRSVAPPQTGGLADPASLQAREGRGRSIEGLVVSTFLLEKLRSSCQGRAPAVSSDDSDLSNMGTPEAPRYPLTAPELG